MPRAWSRTKHAAAGIASNQRGFSPVELLLAVAIFGLISVGVIGALVYGRESTAEAGNRARATLLAEEALEAVRNVRDASYASLADGTYGLSNASGSWVLSGSSDTTDIYSRSVTISSGGTNRKNITSTVSWPQASGTGSVTVNARLTNWLGGIIKSWFKPTLAGALNAASTNNGTKIAINGNYAYVVRADGTPDFVIVNISNPAAPTLTGSLSLSGTPTNVAINGNYAYVTTTDDAAELRIINVTNPASPAISGTYNATGAGDGSDVYLANNRAYLSRKANGGSDELVVVGGTVTAPTRTAGYSLNVNMNEVYANTTTVYVATGSDTQEVISLSFNGTAFSAPVSINLAGTTDATTIDGFGSAVAVGQGTAFHTIYQGTLGAFNGFNVVDSLTMSGVVNDIAIHTDRQAAFVATSDGTKEFQVVNITDLTNTSLGATLDLTGTNVLSGVAYGSALNVVAGASSSDTQEVPVFVPNN
jgi:Tfp pilus assembly protein PilV